MKPKDKSALEFAKLACKRKPYRLSTQEEIEKLTKCLEPINNSENYYLI